MKKNIKLYSVFFPTLGLLLADYTMAWKMIIPNVIVLTAVCIFVLILKKTRDWKKSLPKMVGGAFLASLLADVAAIVFRYLPTLAEMALRLFGADKAAGYIAKYWSDFTWYGIWEKWNLVGLSWTVGSIVIAGVVAFCLHYFVLMKSLVADKKSRLLVSALLAIFSAPYTWLNPAW